MIKKLLSFPFLIFAVVSQLSAQPKSQIADCRKIFVQDADKRGFDEMEALTLGVDGDGKLDTITPRTFVVKNNRKASGNTDPKAREIHWIAFDLKSDNGSIISSFFKYNYRTDIKDFKMIDNADVKDPQTVVNQQEG